MKPITRAHAFGAAAIIVLVAAALVWGPGLCRVPRKERAPGPVVMWVRAEPEAEYRFNEFIRDFTAKSGVRVHLEFKQEWELRAPFMTAETLQKGLVDVVEVDVFDLEGAAPLMSAVPSLVLGGGESDGSYAAAVETGVFEGRTLYIPWRLSWPLLVQSKENKSRSSTWYHVGAVVQEQPGRLLVPAIKDREFLAFLCCLIWGYGGDPNDPDGKGFREAFEWLERARGKLDWRSDVSQASDVLEMGPEKLPGMFFTWPQEIVPLVAKATIPLFYDPQPMPCGNRGCGVFFFGRFLAVPEGARHPEDAHGLIGFLTSTPVQSRIILATPWVPMRSNAWVDLGVRKEAYDAVAQRGPQLKPAPKDLARMEEALPRAARMVVWGGASPETAIKAYKEMMAGKDPGESE